jgi:hypothetical protein
MNLTNISEATERFEVLQTSKRSQSAMMTLASGASTGKKAEANKKSDQILLVQKGKLNRRSRSRGKSVSRKATCS